MAKPLYDFQLTLKAVDHEEIGYSLVINNRTEVESFSVAGGLKRMIWKDGREGIGDADIMAEFYQAKQFQNLFVQKTLNRSTLDFDRIYYRNLSFDLTFEVTSRHRSSRFSSMHLEAKNAQIIEPPNRDSRTEKIKIKFSEPKIFYWHGLKEKNVTKIVQSEL